MKEGYKLEFLKKPLGSGIKETSVSSKNIDILQEEIDIILLPVLSFLSLSLDQEDFPSCFLEVLFLGIFLEIPCL
jgi:hypothetical protein